MKRLQPNIRYQIEQSDEVRKAHEIKILGGEFSEQSSKYKFSGVLPYFNLRRNFPVKYFTIAEFLNNTETKPVFFIIDNIKNIPFSIKNHCLIEAAMYEDETFYIMLFPKRKTELIINNNKKQQVQNVKNVEILLVSTEHKQYNDCLQKTVDFYLENTNFGINIQFYGKSTLNVNNERISLFIHPLDDFHLAVARNHGLRTTTSSHVFMLDIDTMFEKIELERIIELYKTRSPCIFNLKRHYKDGNGLWFGSTKDLLKNGYNEKFQRLWREDTEFMMNFSRTGFLPTIIKTTYHQLLVKEHKYYWPNPKTNYDLFVDIMQRGKRYD